MSNKQINQYTAAVSIDPSNDYFLIDPGGTGAYNKINRNTTLGLSSAPLGTTDTQSPQNKTLDNTNTITVKDGSLTIQNSSSTTKQAVFSASGITAGQTRTFTFPDASTTLVGTGTTQTLTNKTLTSPTISGGTIDNSTITVDAVNGHTTSTIVTIANLQISNGVLNSANAVTATSIAAGAIQPQALVSGTGSGWTWQSWTPTWTNLTPGNGTYNENRYIQIGKTVFLRLSFALGSASSVGTGPTFTLPVTAASYSLAGGTDQQYIGRARYSQVGVGSSLGFIGMQSTTTAALLSEKADQTYVYLAQVTATVPITWSTGHVIAFFATYEAA